MPAAFIQPCAMDAKVDSGVEAAAAALASLCPHTSSSKLEDCSLLAMAAQAQLAVEGQPRMLQLLAGVKSLKLDLKVSHDSLTGYTSVVFEVQECGPHQQHASWLSIAAPLL